MQKLTNTFPWLKYCVSKMDVTNIGKSYDYLSVITGSTKTGSPIKDSPKKNKANTQQNHISENAEKDEIAVQTERKPVKKKQANKKKVKSKNEYERD